MILFKEFNIFCSPVVTIRTTSLTFSNSTFCPHSVFMCFVWIAEQTAIISLYNINWLVFVTETECVYCAVRTGSKIFLSLSFPLPLYIISLSLHLSPWFSHHVGPVQSQVIPHGIFSGEIGTGSDFSPNHYVFPSQHHISGVPISYSLTCCSNKRENWAKPRNFPGKQWSFRNLQNFIKRYFTALPWLV